ncbi:MAG: nicotinate-nucleotide adenylyltransferase [Oceanobacter sp.]
MPTKTSSTIRCAILGGTFDPVHVGHLRVAIQLREAGFDRVLMMPNKTPPHRPQPMASSEQRLQMLALATQDLEGVEVCSVELERDELSYSVVTLELLKAAHPNHIFTWVLGDDAWSGFDRWHRCDDLFELANLLIIHRPGEKTDEPEWQANQLQNRQTSLQELLSCAKGAISRESWPGLDVSASALRNAISKGKNIRFLVPDAVFQHLQQQPLYR